jgi:hypothetical protein
MNESEKIEYLRNHVTSQMEKNSGKSVLKSKRILIDIFNMSAFTMLSYYGIVNNITWIYNIVVAWAIIWFLSMSVIFYTMHFMDKKIDLRFTQFISNRTPTWYKLIFTTAYISLISFFWAYENFFLATIMFVITVGITSINYAHEIQTIFKRNTEAQEEAQQSDSDRIV